MNTIKRMHLLLALLFIGSSLMANDSLTVKSTLYGVTVYTQGAQLQHRCNYTIKKTGVSQLIIEGISPSIAANTIQVKATGNVVILDSKYENYYPQPAGLSVQVQEFPPKVKTAIRQLEDSLRTVSFELRDINDEIDVLQAARKIIMSNGAIKGQGKVNDSIQLLKQAVDYYTTKVSELNKRISALDRQKLKKADQIQAMEVRLNDLKNYFNQNKPQGTKHIPRIIVTLMAKDLTSGKVELSYFASNAGWTPIYDIRSEASSGKISLTYKAQVKQRTGLDWDDIKLSISTNNPYANKTKPELSPWYIDYQVYRKQLDDKAKLKEMNYNAAPQVNSYMFNSGFAYGNTAVSEDQPALTAGDFTTVVQQLIAAEFKIDLNYSIASDNQTRMVLIKQTDLNTSFRYYAVPKIDPGVYLVAQMTKLDELQLVPAKANIFFDGTYIGETYIDPTTMNDTLNLSLGRDPNIMVKRTMLKNQCKDRTIQDKHERTFVYNMEVKNLKSSEVLLTIQDQIPITTNPEISIERTSLGKGKIDDMTGLIEWEFKLKPKETETFNYEFKVKHPKDKDVQL
jgi:uncharacterized protein (TIGR02231 family)